MKVALIGSSGYIAGFLLKRFSEMSEIESVLKIDRNDESDAYLDLRNAEVFDYDLLNNIDFIVFTAAISGPDQCANDFKNCWRINVTGTCYFIKEALKRNCRVLFFSSDAVFGDTPTTGNIYDEESVTAAITPYGRMKKAVEDEFRGNANFKAIRLSYVASAKDRFISYCLNCIKNSEVANIFHPFYRNVIVVSDVIDVVVYFAKHWEQYKPVFLNVAGKELVSRVRMADELNRHLGDKLRYRISMPNEVFFRNRPRVTQMKSLYMQQYKILPDDTFTEKIAKELEEFEL